MCMTYCSSACVHCPQNPHYCHHSLNLLNLGYNIIWQDPLLQSGGHQSDLCTKDICGSSSKKGGCFWQALERWPSSRILGKGLSIFLLFAYFFGSNFGCITYSICRHLTNSQQGYYGWSKSLQCTGVHIDAFNRRYVLGGVQTHVGTFSPEMYV